MPLTYASLCDGIGAVYVAWQPLGWRCAWTSEIEPFACSVVEHHWNLPNLGDMTKIDGAAWRGKVCWASPSRRRSVVSAAR